MHRDHPEPVTDFHGRAPIWRQSARRAADEDPGQRA
jgi:hypothetical protein